MRKTDLFLIGLLLLFTGFAYFFIQQPTTASCTFQVRHKNKIIANIKRSELTAPREISLITEDGTMKILLDPQKGARILSSPCREQLCVNAPPITKVGQTILCLPEKLLITIIGEKKEGDPDAILR